MRNNTLIEWQDIEREMLTLSPGNIWGISCWQENEREFIRKCLLQTLRKPERGFVVFSALVHEHEIWEAGNTGEWVFYLDCVEMLEEMMFAFLAMTQVPWIVLDTPLAFLSFLERRHSFLVCCDHQLEKCWQRLFRKLRQALVACRSSVILLDFRIGENPRAWNHLLGNACQLRYQTFPRGFQNDGFIALKEKIST